MKIPSEFTIMGQTIKLIRDDKKCQDGTVYGLADFDHNTIYYSRTEILGKKTKKLPLQKVHQTICHEIAHFFLHAMGETKLCYNEKFVDVLGSCIYMFLTTKK